MIGTRDVLAVAAVIIIIIATLVLRSGREVRGLWLMTLGFLVASLWSGLGLGWTQNHTGMLSFQSYILLGSTAVVATIYYWTLAREASANQ